MSKSHVSMETKQCLVCAKEFNVGILLNRRLSNSLEPKTLTGYGLCDEHNKSLPVIFVEDAVIDKLQECVNV